MKGNILIKYLSRLFAVFTSWLSTGACRAGDLRDALKHAGGNRVELETSLREIKCGNAEYLISRSYQYDLVNLTANQIIENMTYARKVHVALPYLGKKLDDEMWREWVLPNRVLDEDSCLWRKDYYEMMQPVIAGKKNTWEAVQAIHSWLLIGQDGKPPQVVFGSSENRGKTPL